MSLSTQFGAGVDLASYAKLMQIGWILPAEGVCRESEWYRRVAEGGRRVSPFCPLLQKGAEGWRQKGLPFCRRVQKGDQKGFQKVAEGVPPSEPF